MAAVHHGRYGAEIDGDFAVFLIGARLNSPRQVLASLQDLGGRRRGMRAMLDSAMADPEKGLLGYRMGFPTIVQYWRSFEHLEAFARDPGDLHRPTWLAWFRRERNGRTGIWHESYLVRAGEYEAVYDSVPEAGLAVAGRVVPLAGTSSARIRLRREGAGSGPQTAPPS
jgi:fumigallin biosynthesis monooxygenase-like protein